MRAKLSTTLIGKHLGPFEITAKLGEGGMGEVWRARDPRLDREVAVKVVPEAFVADAERLARFEREARILASLSHPSIARIHDVGEAGGVHYLVMELVAGETLADRLARGPLPPQEALDLAAQIAAAVAAAHDQGVVHRDLKPGNVMVAPDGSAKVLDFGLAKALTPEAGSASAPDLTRSPTLTIGQTAAGMLLGTAAYMSPEQAKGRPVDRRSDVWAWGCLLYEMLTGRAPFRGDSVAEVLAAILHVEPDYDALPEAVPASVERVLRRCLEKDPKMRLRDVGDARLLLGEETAPGGAAVATGRGFGWREATAWGLAAAGVVAALAFLVLWRGDATSASPPPLTRFAVSRSAEAADSGLRFADQPVLAFSPDGRTLAFVGERPGGGGNVVYFRRLESTEALPVTGTDGASSPFFSPDGRSLGFFADGHLETVPVGGGAVVTLADTENPRGGVWLPDGSIVYSPRYSSGLWSVPASGGVAHEIVPLDEAKGERTYRWPDVWSDGRSLLFTVGSQDSPNDYENASIELWDADTGARRTLVEGAAMARFLAPDRLVFYRGSTLYAERVDPRSKTVSGAPLSVLQGVAGEPSSGAGYFALAGDGSLAYIAGAGDGARSQLAIVERDGTAHTLDLDIAGFHHPRFSADGTRLAFTIGLGRAGASGDIWTWSLTDRHLERLTFDARGVYPLWSPVGNELAYNDDQGAVMEKSASGAGAVRTLVEHSGDVILPGAWSPDGKTVALTWIGGSLPELFLKTAGEKPRLFERDASSPAFSPDGRWLAYQQPAAGNAHVYVRAVEGPGKWQVSPEVASYPRWPWRAGELFYLSSSRPSRELLAVSVESGEAGPRFGPPHVVLADTTAFTTSTAPLVNWDVDPAGRRFVFVEPERGPEARQVIQVALHWGASLALPGS